MRTLRKLPTIIGMFAIVCATVLATVLAALLVGMPAASAAAPNTVITSGASQPSTQTYASFIFHSVPSGGSFECQLDSRAWAACDSPARLTGLGGGAHTFRVRARNSGGRDATPAQYSWTVGPRPMPSRNINVLIVNMDDMRSTGTMSAMPKTRRWFADSGVTFPSGYVTTPDCCPSRSSLFSGRYAHNHGNVNNQTTKSLDHAGTLAAYLGNAGYQTGMAGRFLQRWPHPDPPPFYDRWAVTGSGYTNSLFATDTGQLTAAYGTTEIGRQAVRMLDAFETADSRPFLLYLAPLAPHTPFTAEAKYAGAAVGPCQVTPAMTETDRADKPPWIRSKSNSTQVGCDRRVKQLRTLLSADDMVDRVMTRLSHLGEGQNTIAIFTSDNGYMWAEHGLVEKFVPYTEAIRVPLLVRWPGRVGAGTVDNRLAANVDVLSSLLAATGVTPSLRYPLDGRPFLTSTGLSSNTRAESFIEQHPDSYAPDFPRWASIRTGSVQYVEWSDDAGRVLFREYYDLTRDPHQLVNLLADGDPSNPSTSALATRMRGYRTCRGTGSGGCP